MGKKRVSLFSKEVKNYVRRIKLLKLSIVRYAIAALISQLIDSSMYCSGFQNSPTPDTMCRLLAVFASGTFEPKFQIINLNSETLR